MEIIWTVIIGFFAGLIARFLMPGKDAMGFIFTTLLGIAGSLIGQFFGQAIGVYESGEPAGFIAAVLGAMVLLLLARMFWQRAY